VFAVVNTGTVSSCAFVNNSAGVLFVGQLPALLSFLTSVSPQWYLMEARWRSLSRNPQQSRM
jgi:hypothetical protein